MSNHNKHRLPIRGAGFIVLIAFIYSLATTLIIPVMPIYIKRFFSSPAYVGYFLAFTYLLILIYILSTIYFLKYFNKWLLLKISALGFSITLFLLTLVNTLTQLVIVEIFRSLFIAVSFVIVGLLIRDESTKKTINRNEGLYFSIINSSFFIGPIIGGLLANAYSLNQVFRIAALFPLIVFLFLIGKRDTENKKPEDVNLIKSIILFFQNRQRTINYLITLGLLSWLTIIYIYTPLYMAQEGLNEKIIGYFLALTVLPLIILEVPATRLTQKYGYRKLFFLGFLLIALFGALTFFIDNIYIKLLLLILTNVGVAFIEPLKEAYFFETSNRKEETRYYPIFKTAIDVGYLTGPIIFSTILLFTNFKSMFLIASLIMIVFGIISLSIKK